MRVVLSTVHSLLGAGGGSTTGGTTGGVTDDVMGVGHVAAGASFLDGSKGGGATSRGKAGADASMA